MIQALIVLAEDAVLIDRENRTHASIQLTPVVDANGIKFLPLDLRSDCGPCGIWRDYHSIIMGLETGEVTPLAPTDG